MLKATAKLLVCYENTLRPELFKQRLSRYSAKEITRVARERRSGSMGFAEALLLYYNKKSRNPLRWNNLYSNKGDIEDDEQLDDLEVADEDAPEDQSHQISFSSLRFPPQPSDDDEAGDEQL